MKSPPCEGFFIIYLFYKNTSLHLSSKLIEKSFKLSAYLSSHFFARSHLNAEHFSNNLKARLQIKRYRCWTQNDNSTAHS